MQALQEHARLRVLRHEGLHVPAHVMETDRVDGGHPHRPFHPLLGGKQARARIVESLEEISTGLEEDLTRLGRDQGPPGTVEEGHIELGLELLDGLARRGLRDAIARGGAGKAPEPHDFAKQLEGVEVHGSELSSLAQLILCFCYFMLG